MTLAVRDTAESQQFLCKYLGCKQIPVPDAALETRGVRWVRLAGGSRGSGGVPLGEIHLIPSAVDKDLGSQASDTSPFRIGRDTDGDGVVSAARSLAAPYNTPGVDCGCFPHHPVGSSTRYRTPHGGVHRTCG